MGFFESFNRGLKGDYSYEIAGHTVTCSHCGGQEFVKTEGQLNTAAMSFLGLDWANREATVFECKTCGHLEWFL